MVSLSVGSSRWLVCFLSFFLAGALALAARTPTEYEVKGAFLLNFAKFVDWPSTAFANDRAPLVIAILGDDPSGEALPAILKGQTVKGRGIEMRYPKSEAEAVGSHILFVSRSEADRHEEILRGLRGQPILTVSVRPEFLRQGGVIVFALVDKAVRFDINSNAASEAGLKPSSKLLAVARSVVN